MNTFYISVYSYHSHIHKHMNIQVTHINIKRQIIYLHIHSLKIQFKTIFNGMEMFKEKFSTLYF